MFISVYILWKRKVVVHVAYLLRPTLVHIGIEGGSKAGSRDNGHTSIYFHSFFVSHQWKMVSENERFKLMRAYTFTQ